MPLLRLHAFKRSIIMASNLLKEEAIQGMKILDFLIRFAMLSSLVLHVRVLSCDQIQRDSLSSFYRHVSSSPALDWSSPDCCRWEGLACDSYGHNVTRLSLPGRGLYGKITPFMGNLSFISYLNLSHNSLSGPIPPQLLHDFNHLQVLDLSFNSFTGSIGSDFLFPSSIKIIDLSSNQFNGSVYPSFFRQDSSNLISLNVSNNSFSGLMPTSICTGSRLLKVLDFSVNIFTGPILPGIGRCSHLRIFRAGFNYLSGLVPQDLYSMKRLNEISLNNNCLSGPVDGGIVLLSSLRILELHFNEFSGGVPRNIGLLSNLEQLQLHNNLLNGSLPFSLKDCSNLKSLLVRNNLLAGEVSNLDFSNLKRLQTIDLGNNSFSGKIPESLCSCGSLTAVRLAYNQFVGDIPPCMSSLTSLTYVSFSNNKLSNVAGALKTFIYCRNLAALLLTRCFNDEMLPNYDEMSMHSSGFQNLQILALAGGQLKGQIPSWISKLGKLKVLNLSYNRISGPIPTWLGNMPSLVSLNFTHNLLTGSLESEFCRFPALTEDNIDRDLSSLELPFLFETFQYNRLDSLRQGLKLGNNNLSGNIPAEIGRLRLLRMLDLRNNNFRGTIPEQLSNLVNLERLDLSGNHLSGKIPQSLSKLHFLSAFSVANNDLEGETVRGVQFGTFPAASFEGNPKLCGSVLERICENTIRADDANEDSDDESRSILSYDVKIPFGVGYIVGIFTVTVTLRMKNFYSRDS